jgi:hypothetical protein
MTVLSTVFVGGRFLAGSIDSWPCTSHATLWLVLILKEVGVLWL